MSTGTLSPSPYLTVLDANGNPVSGALIYTYVAGTTTPATTYSDVNLSVANANPIVADSAGRYVAYLSPGSSYKFVIQDASAVAIRTQDNISTVPPASVNLDVTGIAGEAISAGFAAYLSDGSGSKTAGSWYKADNTNSYSSTLPVTGIAPAAIASGASGTIRLSGQVTGLTSLVVGTSYYVGAAGVLTPSAPTNRRLLGVADTTSSIVIIPNPPLPPANVQTCQGRLTLTTGTPVTTSDVTAATTLYFSPYQGNRIALFDGTNWAIRTFSEVSIAVPASTSQLYDVFAYDNSGAVTLELLAWTNDTTRATALTTQDGIYVKTGATTRRYLGSIRTTTVSGQTEDSLAKRYVWNYTNRLQRVLRVNEATATWTYTTNTLRQANGSTSNQVDVVVGVAEVPINLRLVSSAQNTNTGVNLFLAIGEDSTTAAATGSDNPFMQSALANGPLSFSAMLVKFPAVGRHFYSWLEQSAATGTTTWYGAGVPTQSGLSGTIEG